MGRVAFLKLYVGQASRRGALVPSFDQIARNIDPQHVGPEPGRGNCSRAIAASDVEDLHFFLDPDPLHE